MESKCVSLSEVVMNARTEGDMEVSETEIVECLQRCISTINASIGVKLPPVDMMEWMTNYSNTDGYRYDVCTQPYSNDILLRNVFHPFIIYDFKRKAEQFEYSKVMMGQFQQGLNLFRGKYLSHLKPEYQGVINETDNYLTDETYDDSDLLEAGFSRG